MFRVALKIVFFCKLAKDQPFDNCQLKTPQGRTLNTTKNGDAVIGAKYLVFSPLVPSKQEKNYISFTQLFLLGLYIFEGSVFTFQFSNDKIPSKNMQTKQN